MSRTHHGMTGAEGAGLVMVGILLAALLFYAIVKCCNMCCRVLAAHSGNKLLWGLLCGLVFFGILALATKGEPIATALCGVCLLAFLLTCRLLDLYHAPALLPAGSISEKVLHEKWWQPVTPEAALAA